MIVVIEVVCAECGKTANLPVADLLVRFETDTGETDCLMFDCPACATMITVAIRQRTAATLLLAGAVEVPARGSGDRICRNGQPTNPFTAEDVRAWHELLREVETVAPWE